jgi:hypothetical protein
LDEKAVKATKLLESLKSEIKDWDVIDTKIDFLNSNLGDKFKTNYKVGSIIKYGEDDEVLLLLLEEQVKR